jgi:hypothetical protein
MREGGKQVFPLESSRKNCPKTPPQWALPSFLPPEATLTPPLSCLELPLRWAPISFPFFLLLPWVALVYYSKNAYCTIHAWLLLYFVFTSIALTLASFYKLVLSPFMYACAFINSFSEIYYYALMHFFLFSFIFISTTLSILLSNPSTFSLKIKPLGHK